jgi:Domain of unknown function (DUF3854)
VNNNNSQNQTFSNSKTSPASNSQSYTQQHPEQQANNQSPVQPPNNLTEAEYHELAVSSAIHPELIARNFIHIAGETVLNYLFISNAIPRLNTGRVTSSLLKLYQYATIGGMWISGLDPFNNWQRMEWGRFKPTQGRIDKNGKLVKYESPPKTPNRVTYFDVPDCIWDLVARRYNIKRYHSPLAQRLQDKLNPLSFWEWVLLHPEIPIILCEGEKKAACLLSQGFVAIALPGIWSGRIGKQDFDERLHPDIMPFTQPGRKFIILFDYETKPKTRWSIFQATLRTGKTIEAVGCTCEVALLPGPEKGVDDFVVERSKLIVRGQTVSDSQLIEQSRKSTITQVINQTLPVKNSNPTENCQVVERYQVINHNSPFYNNQPLNNGQVANYHQVLNQNLPVHNNQPLNINNGQILDHYQVINQTLEGKDKKLTENGQILEHHQVNNQNLEGKNNELTENCQILEHHQVNNQNLPVPDNQLTKNGQILDHHQVNNHISKGKNNELTENAQIPEHHQVINQNLKGKNNELTENAQIPEHHQVINQNLKGKNNELTENAQIPEHHQAINQIPPFKNSQVNALLTTIIDDAISLKQYQRSFHTRHRGLSRKYKPDIRVNVKYLSSAVTLPASGLVALSSDMGTGKTEIMSLLREAYPHIKFLNIGHRVNLLKNLATRLKTEMYSDLTFAGLVKAQALSITIDSLHKLHTQMLNYGCIFIDEACQFLTHLLHSKTCKEYRAEILEVLQYIVYNAPLVIIADAHLDDITVDFFRALRPPGEKPFIVKNDWRNGDRLIYWYEGKNSSAIVAQISAALMNKQKIMVASDSKRFIKKLEQSLTIKVRVEEAGGREQGAGGLDTSAVVKDCSSQISQINSTSSEAINNCNSATSFQVKPTSSATDKNDNSPALSQINSTSSNHSPTPDTPHHSDLGVNAQSNANAHRSTTSKLRLWSIHSDNSGSEENVAFIKDITNAVKDVDALLYSPSLGTGVDINEYHFDLVFGIFHAKSQTATECAQQLYRYRPNVPIHVWVAPRPPFGYQETNAQKIKERMLQTNEVTAFVLRIDRETGRRGVEKDWALDAYCKILAARNRSINNLRDDLHDLLTEMGNKIISMGGDEDTFAQEQMKKAAAALDTAYYFAVTKAKDISATEYRQRQNKDYLKPEEIFECEKYRIQEAYGMEVTESLVEKDAGGQLNRSISALEAILKEPEGTIFDSRNNRQYPLPPTIVTDKDRQERENLPLCMDWGNYSAKWLARFNLGLHDILKRLVAGEEVTARDPNLLKMVAIAKQYGVYIRTILGFNVPDKCQPIWLLGMLLDQLGLKLVDRKEGPRGKQVRIFSLSQVELDFALKVIEYRELKRNQKQERARQQQESQRRYQARMQTLYGVAPPPDPVSTPPPNGIGKPLGEGVNTTVDPVDFGACSGDGNETSLVNGADGVDFAACSRNGNDLSLVNGADRVDFRQFQPDDGDETPLINCVEVLRTSFKKGVEAIKSVLRSWSEDRRWGTVLLLEEIAAGELRSLEKLMPQFYDWLSESVLPMNC